MRAFRWAASAFLAQAFGRIPLLDGFANLDDAYAFLHYGDGSQAKMVGFFNNDTSVDQTVFLTVAKELLQDNMIAPELGRAELGNYSTGGMVYIVPRGRAVQPNGSAITPLFTHGFRLPASPSVPELSELWEKTGRSYGKDKAEKAAVSPMKKWEDVLEVTSLLLHHLAQMASLPDVFSLDTSTADPVLTSTPALALLVLPAGVKANTRGYHTRRLDRIAATYPQIRCTDGEPVKQARLTLAKSMQKKDANGVVPNMQEAAAELQHMGGGYPDPWLASQGAEEWAGLSAATFDAVARRGCPMGW